MPLRLARISLGTRNPTRRSRVLKVYRRCYCRLRKTLSAKKSLLRSEHKSRQAGVRAGTLNPTNSDFDRDDIASSCLLKQELVTIQQHVSRQNTQHKPVLLPLPLVFCARRLSSHYMVPALLERCLNNEAARRIPDEIEWITGDNGERRLPVLADHTEIIGLYDLRGSHGILMDSIQCREENSVIDADVTQISEKAITVSS